MSVVPGTPSDQASTLRQMARERRGFDSALRPGAPAGAATRVLTVTSGKGGVGKTILTANLAICLRRRGRRVLVLDADLGLANIDVLMGLAPRKDLSHVLRGEISLREAMIKGPAGVRVIPAASGDEDLANLDEVGRLNLLSQFDALEEDFDDLLIDSGAGISNNVIFFNLAAQSPLVLVTPEPTSITDAYAIIKVLSQDHRVDRFLVLVNRARDEKESRSVFETLLSVSDRFLRSISLDYLGFLPEDARVNRAIRARRPVVEAYPSAPISAALDDLSRRLAEITVKDGARGYPGFLRQKRLGQT